MLPVAGTPRPPLSLGELLPPEGGNDTKEKSMTIRISNLQVRLRALGCRPLRCRGSHQTWNTPGNQRLCLKVNHPGNDVSRLILARVRRILRQEGLSL